MRLDHLLSKEHTVRASRPDAPSRSLAIRRQRCPPPSPAARPRTSRRRALADRARGRRASLFRFEGTTGPPEAARVPLVTPPASGRAAARRLRPWSVRRRWTTRALLENSIASTSIYVLQVTKSQRRMPWRLKPMKDVGGCDKPRGVADQAWIRGCPNGETRHPSWGVTLA